MATEVERGSDPLGYYTALGLSPGASDRDIKRAYRKKKRYRSWVQSDESWNRIERAYSTLSDPTWRGLYDTENADAPVPYESATPVPSKVLFTPQNLDFGDMRPGEKKALVLRMKNAAETPIRLFAHTGTWFSFQVDGSHSEEGYVEVSLLADIPDNATPRDLRQLFEFTFLNAEGQMDSVTVPLRVNVIEADEVREARQSQEQEEERKRTDASFVPVPFLIFLVATIAHWLLGKHAVENAWDYPLAEVPLAAFIVSTILLGWLWAYASPTGQRAQRWTFHILNWLGMAMVAALVLGLIAGVVILIVGAIVALGAMVLVGALFFGILGAFDD